MGSDEASTITALMQLRMSEANITLFSLGALQAYYTGLPPL